MQGVEAVSNDDEFQELRFAYCLVHYKIIPHCCCDRRAIAISSTARATLTQKPDSTSKVTAVSTLPQEALKVNSFKAALAKKGITLKNALEKSSAGSPRKEQYFADLNGYRVP